jgi:predicted nucleic acid-binding Zn ribbon protein
MIFCLKKVNVHNQYAKKCFSIENKRKRNRNVRLTNNIKFVLVSVWTVLQQLAEVSNSF